MPTLIERNSFLSIFWAGYLHENMDKDQLDYSILHFMKEQKKKKKKKLHVGFKLKTRFDLLTCLVRSYTNVCSDGVQSTLSVYIPVIWTPHTSN